MLKKAFLSMLGLILAIAIMCFLFYMAATVYFGSPTTSKQTKESSSEQSLGSMNYHIVIDSARQTVDGVNKQLRLREKEMESLR